LVATKVERVNGIPPGPVTISFYAKVDSGTKPVSVELTQYFGTGGSPSADVNTFIGKVTLTTTWQRFTLTFTPPSISGKTLGSNDNSSFNINFWLDAGSNFNARTSTLGQQSGTFDFAGLQIERGSVATPLEILSFQDYWLQCQRYYQAGVQNNCGVVTYSAGNSLTWTPFNVRMRSAPSSIGITGTTFTSVTAGAFSSNQIGLEGFTTIWSSSNADNDNGAVSFNWTASAEL
jgi:hypothetical protein